MARANYDQVRSGPTQAQIDAARAQARTSGTPIVWRATAQGFEFIGASPRRDASE